MAIVEVRNGKKLYGFWEGDSDALSLILFAPRNAAPRKVYNTQSSLAAIRGATGFREPTDVERWQDEVDQMVSIPLSIAMDMLESGVVLPTKLRSSDPETWLCKPWTPES